MDGAPEWAPMLLCNVPVLGRRSLQFSSAVGIMSMKIMEVPVGFFSSKINSREALHSRMDWILAPKPSKCVGIAPDVASYHLYFSVRPFGSDCRGEVLQYAFADGRGNVVVSAFARALRPSPTVAPGARMDLAVDPMDPDTLDHLLTHLCGGATLVGFGRVLQAGLLPPGVAASAASVQCAWRRFQRLSRRRGLRPEWSRPLTLADALELAGLTPPESEDAALRALAIRDLWEWMDRTE